MKLSELEVKVHLHSPQHFKEVFETCQKLYGAPTSHLLQSDEYYDTPDRELQQKDLVIRIRTIDGKKIIALKSPRVKLPSGISDRVELEFAAAEGHSVTLQLEHQGLKVFEASEKERWTFVDNDIEIVFDLLPFIGAFVEVEGPSEEVIHEVLRSLGLSPEGAIGKNYSELLRAKFEELGLHNIPATFAAEEQWKHEQIPACIMNCVE